MIDWNRIETVLLDMDGTLLDLHFDNQFWLEHVPLRYSEKHGVDLAHARQALRAEYNQIAGTMNWYCIDHWSGALDLDIAVLKHELRHLIQVHPHVREFLDAVRASGRRTVLVTNAHQKSLALKMEHTALDGHLDRLICAHDLGLPKEEPAFWPKLQTLEPYDPTTTLLVDDSLPVLRSAKQGGIAHLLGVRQPDTKQPEKELEEFAAIRSFNDLLPVAH